MKVRVKTLMDDVILKNDPRAATYRTDITGWVGRNGNYYGRDEGRARRESATHRVCDVCGNIIEVHAFCVPCYDRKKIDKYNAMPEKEWDEETPVYSQTNDEYHESWSDVCDEDPNEKIIEALQLIICEPKYLKEIDPYEYYSYDIPDGGDLPDQIYQAFERLNKVIRESRDIICYVPGEYRVKRP